MSESNGELTELLCTQMAVNAPAELIVHKRVALVSVKPVCRFIYFYQGIIVFFIFVCFIRFPYDGMIVLVIHITVILINKAVVVVNAQLLIYTGCCGMESVMAVSPDHLPFSSSIS